MARSNTQTLRARVGALEKKAVKPVALPRRPPPRPLWYLDLGGRLLEARQIAGRTMYGGDMALTLNEVARKAGITNNLLARYESGRVAPSLFVLRELAVALQTSVDGLLDLAECPECGRTLEREAAAKHCCPSA